MEKIVGVNPFEAGNVVIVIEVIVIKIRMVGIRVIIMVIIVRKYAISANHVTLWKFLVDYKKGLLGLYHTLEMVVSVAVSDGSSGGIGIKHFLEKKYWKCAMLVRIKQFNCLLYKPFDKSGLMSYQERRTVIGYGLGMES